MNPRFLTPTRLTISSAGAATLIRIPYVRILSVTDDFLFTTLDIAIWSTVEPGLGICAASAASLRPLFRNFYALSTRDGTASKTPKYATFNTHGSAWRNSRHGYVKNIDAGGSRSAASENLELDDCVGRSGTRSKITGGGLGTKACQKGLWNTSQTRVSESSEDNIKGIQIDKTVEIIRSNREGEFSFDERESP